MAAGSPIPGRRVPDGPIGEARGVDGLLVASDGDWDCEVSPGDTTWAGAQAEISNIRNNSRIALFGFDLLISMVKLAISCKYALLSGAAAKREEL